MLKRTHLNSVNNLIKKNSSWKVLDIGCGYSANENANVIADTKDLSSYYKERNFIHLKEKVLPFKDKEFDFVICSHVLEHVEDISFLIMELQRIANQGYIELPTRLEDNLVFENKNDHIWSMSYNDEKNLLLISKRQQIIEPILTVSSIKNLNKYFRDSFVIEIHWYKDINFKIVDNNLEFKKISRLKLFKKFFSKNIRSMFKKKN